MASPDDDIRWNFKMPRGLYEEFGRVCKTLGASKADIARILIGEWLAGMQRGEERRWVPTTQEQEAAK